jgi:hypothetical protein
MSPVHPGDASIPDTLESPASVSIRGIPHIQDHRSTTHLLVPLDAEPRKDIPD